MGDDGEIPQNRNAEGTGGGELAPVRRDPARGPDGRILPGNTINPGGRPLELAALQQSIRSRHPELIARLFDIALNGPRTNPTTVRAAEVLLERGFGKAPVMIEDAEGRRMMAAVIVIPAEKEEP
jgi:hypothetical protein